MRFGGAKRWGNALKSPFGVTIEATRRGIVFMGNGGSYYVILLC